MDFDTLRDMKKPYRVYWNTMGYTTYYWVDTLEQAKLVIDILTLRECDDESVVWNTQGLEVFNEYDDVWEEWYSDDEGYDICEYFEEED